MSSVANVTIHSSQFPEQVQRDLIESLRNAQVNHKFHYDSVKQTMKWLGLHQAYSPSRNDPACVALYAQSFEAVRDRLKSRCVHLIGLGCGGGQKDSHLLRSLADAGRQFFYTPSDVSTAMVLVARQAALALLPERSCLPLVCDLATSPDLPAVLDALVPPGAVRVITFFGMIPNFEPQIILPKLASLLRPTDVLLFSANLAPGPDYAAGIQQVLPLYDNAATRDWLITFLYDLGVEAGDGELRFSIEAAPGGSGLKRITANFQCTRAFEIRLNPERFCFSPGDSIRLFFSYRHTPALIRTLLQEHGLQVCDQWITPSQEEGVFLISRE